MPVTTARAASPGSPTKRISGSQNCEIQPITGVCSKTFIKAKTGIMTFKSRKEVLRPFANPFFQVLAVINYFPFYIIGDNTGCHARDMLQIVYKLDNFYHVFGFCASDFFCFGVKKIYG